MPHIERDKFGTPLFRDQVDILLGTAQEYSVYANIGYARNVTTTPQTIWDEGTIYTFPGSAQQMSLASLNINDTHGGTGANSVLITYLDSAYNLQTEVVSLNGTTPVTTTATDIRRVNGLNVILSGSQKTNLGKIYIGTGTFSTNGTPENKYSVINSTDAASQGGAYTIPANKSAAFIRNNFFISGNKEVVIDFNVEFLGTNTKGVTSRFPVLGIQTFNGVPFSQNISAVDINLTVSAVLSTAESVYMTSQWYFKNN